MSTGGTTRGGADAAHANSPASWNMTWGGDRPTTRLLTWCQAGDAAYRDWLAERGEQFRSGVQIATLDPFQGYKNAIDDQLQDATSVPGSFHFIEPADDALDEVRRHVQQETLGHRVRKGEPRSSRGAPGSSAGPPRAQG